MASDLNVDNVLRNPFKLVVKKTAPEPSDLPKEAGYVVVMRAERGIEFADSLDGLAPAWQLKSLLSMDPMAKPIVGIGAAGGPIWCLRVDSPTVEVSVANSHNRIFYPEGRGLIRDLVGTWARHHQEGLHRIVLNLTDLSSEEIEAALHGLTLAQYRPAKVFQKSGGGKSSRGKPTTHKPLEVQLVHDAGGVDMAAVERGILLGTAQNLARHLVNLPAGHLNPKAYAELLKKTLNKPGRGMSVEVWGPARLRKEKCGLLYGVGQGAEHGSHLVHIRYRPPGTKGTKGKPSKRRPLAFVGKGVTFDTGGLDLKPASGMRLMKKDMGGSATVSALAYFVQGARLSVPCDFYLALTENAVSEKSMRPGDVLFARNGTAVEIHNTDAEGRLALADAIDVAVRAPKAAERPELLVDVATLTGAMRVALGLDVAGYFSNDDDLAAEIEQAGLRAGETTWRMPLVPRYGRMLSSTIADLSNASDGGYGGAITAALFLQHFVGSLPWAHFDVMAFNPGPDGALSEGGNGQAFCTLAEFVLGRD